jgi:ADP-ribose pyrophosphatase YjhB (NUDIX family)
MLADEIRFCPRCGTQLKLQFRMGRERPVCPQCDWVFFPDPKVAAALLVSCGDGLLLVRRGNVPQQGLWTFPGGFVDAGEHPASAAARECQEETGLQVKVTRLLAVLSGQEHPRGAHILIGYQGEVVGGNLRPGDDADRAGFFPPDNLPELAFDSTRQLIDLWLSSPRNR